nr:MAG TPA: hypothetical protein [Caudoviricetes sp.]
MITKKQNLFDSSQDFFLALLIFYSTLFLLSKYIISQMK